MYIYEMCFTFYFRLNIDDVSLFCALLAGVSESRNAKAGDIWPNASGKGEKR